MNKNGINKIILSIGRRAYNSTNPRAESFFTKKPLNHETFFKRIDLFYKQHPSQDKHINEGFFIDFIDANRYLQRQNIRVTSKIGLNTNRNKNFLDIPSYSNNDIELKILDLLNDYKWHTHSKDRVVKSYLLTNPGPRNINHLIDVVQDNFKLKLKKGKVSESIVQTALSLLLEDKDYYNSFELIDLTYNSPSYLEHSKQQILKEISSVILFSLAITVVGYFTLPLLPPFAIAIFAFGVPLILFWYKIKINLVKQLGRISWRPYNNVVYNYLHQKEILMVNKIVTHFEEHNEVNIKNFHHSKVREISNLNVFHKNDYIIELPNNNLLSSINDPIITNEDSEIARLQRFFKHEMRKRKMVLNDLQEELIFLEFWFTHGENFEWVEPDQDPAEIIRLKINHEVP